MPTAHKLPSGNWRCQIRLGNGVRVSVTGATRKEAEYKAAEIQMGKKRVGSVGMSVGDAITAYIDAKDGVLSPTTIQAYRKIRKNDIQALMPIPIGKLTNKVVQAAFNAEAKRISPATGKPLSPKSIHNIYGLFSASVRYQMPDADIEIRLPAKQKQVVTLSTPDEIFAIVRGTDIELPVMLAMWLSLSVSEIRGLQVASVVNDRIVVKGAMVDVGGTAVWKRTNKAYARTRSIACPNYILDLIKATEAWKAGAGFLVPMSANLILRKWTARQDAAGLPHMTFHQLRHLNASVMLKLGVPDTYAMERGGWSSRQTLDTVYQHTLRQEVQAYDERINAYFESLLDS